MAVSPLRQVSVVETVLRRAHEYPQSDAPLRLRTLRLRRRYSLGCRNANYAGLHGFVHNKPTFNMPFRAAILNRAQTLLDRCCKSDFFCKIAFILVRKESSCVQFYPALLSLNSDDSLILILHLASQMTLRRHKLRNHTPRQAWGYQCPHCPEAYMEPASYQQHVLYVSLPLSYFSSHFDCMSLEPVISGGRRRSAVHTTAVSLSRNAPSTFASTLASISTSQLLTDGRWRI